MRKLIATLIILTTLTGTTTVGAADTAMAETLKTVKERIENTDTYTDFNSDMYENDDGNAVYAFSWQKSDDSYERLYVSCTQSGIITGYSDDTTDYAEYGIDFMKNRLPAQEALQKAQQLINKLNPSLSDELVAEMPKTYTGYRFNIKRIKNGLEVKNDGGMVMLDKNAEKICNYSVTITENRDFSTADTLIAKDEAIKNYSEKIGMEPEYKFKYEYNRETHKNERTLYLQYTAKNDEKINALTGEPVIPAKTDGYKYAVSAGAANSAPTEEAADTAEYGFSAAELAETEAVSGLKSKEELTSLARKAVNADENCEAANFAIRKQSYYTDVPAEYIAQVYFKSADSGIYASVSLNAKTGEITYFYKESAAETDTKLSEDKLKSVADEAAEKFGGAKFNEYKTEKYDGNGHFGYVRYVNGIKFADDKINVEINRTTGEVVSFGINYTDTVFPPADGIINKSDAENYLFEQVEYKPVYVEVDGKKMIPVYDFTDGKPLCIDAKTGELLKNGKIYTDDVIKYDDVENHYAKTEINTLAELGHGFDGGSFKPDEYVTQKDFLTLLFGKNTYDVYEWIEMENVGVEKNETAFVTKENAAKILVYNLGNGMFELANTDIFVVPFADVTENVGFAAILKGKNVVTGDENGLFRPTENITRAEAAVMIYRYWVSNGHI